MLKIEVNDNVTLEKPEDNSLCQIARYIYEGN